MLSSLKLTTMTFIGREEEKKLSLILTYLIDLPQASQFLNPVDWEQLNDYPLIIKHPMNLLKVQDKLRGRQYRTIEEVLDHIQLVWDNCKEYNKEGHFYTLADKMERAFKKMIKNYLPNIQVIVPKPIGSSSYSHQSSVPQPSSNNSQPRQPQKASTRHALVAAQNVNLHSNVSNQQPQSVNDPYENYLQEPEEIPPSEKNRFHQRLKQLTQQELTQIVSIIQDNCSQGFKQLGGGRCQILLDNIDAETFKKMNLRIDNILDGQKGMSAPSKKVKI